MGKNKFEFSLNNSEKITERDVQSSRCHPNDYTETGHEDDFHAPARTQWMKEQRDTLPKMMAREHRPEKTSASSP